MGVYSNIELNEINEILRYYDLGLAVSFNATMTGISNSNFKVSLESGKDVLLKISNDKTIEQLTNEQQVLLALEKHHFKYSVNPLKTISGKPIYKHKDYYGVVFPFIDGLPPKISSDVCFQVGAALSSLHSLDITSEDLEFIRPHDEVGFGSLDIIDYINTNDAASDFVADFHSVFPDKLANIPYDVFPSGIIHGDLYFDNSLFKNGDLVSLIDFEQAGRGRFILDLGIAISGSCLGESGESIDKNLMRSFVEGYESNRLLKTIENEYLDRAILVGFFSIALWRIKRFYTGDLDDSKKYNYRELTERAKNFKSSL
jgi:homoserine kinase type II